MLKKQSFKTGLGFGLTSAMITTLGLMVGLYSTTNSKTIVLAGIITIAIADAFSDALGIHISEEYKSKEGEERHVWESTIYTFVCKFFFALIFVIPILALDLKPAIWISIIFGAILLSVLSFFIARQKKERPLNIILEHLFIASIVIILANLVGSMVNKYCC
ncbi:hypothetical protein GF382_02110 [Candidatus Falkowbacteria bacterium]|nr:hypothetical protein [Candidatus Falkowbacteria bacterium]